MFATATNSWPLQCCRSECVREGNAKHNNQQCAGQMEGFIGAALALGLAKQVTRWMG